MPIAFRSAVLRTSIALLVAFNAGCLFHRHPKEAPTDAAPAAAASSATVSEASVFVPAETPADAALTPFGAVLAGDADGIIPAWNGGLLTAVPSYQPGHTLRPNPFYQEKPLFTIDAKNQGDFKDVLTDGSKTLIAKYPGFRIDVYPTHRTAAYPQKVLDNSLLNAQRCQAGNGGLSVVGNGCRGGVPFPAPKSGYEAMWNHLLAWSGVAVNGRQRDWLVDRTGKRVMLAESDVYRGAPWYDDKSPSPQIYRQIFTTIAAPEPLTAIRTLSIDSIDPVGHASVTWQYLPGQRGAREAVGVSHDFYADTGHLRFFDQAGLFSGPLDAFDFKILAKRPMIIPYNDYRQVYHCKLDEDLKPGFINPDCMRWELHRVWVVEAILKHGHSHSSTRRVFYWDEDSWNAGASDEYDTNGKLYRAGFVHFNVWYESQVNSAEQYVIYDFRKGRYALYGEALVAEGGPHAVDPWPPEQLTPDIMAATSVR